jgi:FAD/FMN-containing dehydrogenase
MTFALSGRVSGEVYGPGEAGYAQEIAGFNTAIVHAPDLVVVPESARDVVEAVRYAREQGHHVNVQATGHGAHAPIGSGLLVSTRRLQDVSVEPQRRTACIAAGARWQAVIAAAAEYGLAPIAGSSVTVGVVGYLLGGGLGPLARSHGFSSDYLVGLSVVTGEGNLVEANAEQNADLFWALRGGKCGLGIVMEVRLRLVELRTLYAGALFFDEANIESALRAWVDWTTDADPLISTSVAIVHFPPLDVVPAAFRGRRLLGLRFAYPGASDQGARLAAPLRAAAPVYLDALSELPAADVARIHNDPTEPRPVWSTGTQLTHVDQQFASQLLEHVGAGTNTPFVAAEIRHLGAATERDVEGGSAVGGRGSKFTLGLVSGAKQELFQTVLPAAAERLIDSLRPWVSAETNINFAGKPRSAEHFASCWQPAIFAELTRIRRRYDPNGVFAGEYSR